jgi:hypothetical protein
LACEAGLSLSAACEATHRPRIDVVGLRKGAPLEGTGLPRAAMGECKERRVVGYGEPLAHRPISPRTVTPIARGSARPVPPCPRHLSYFECAGQTARTPRRCQSGQ